MSLSQKHSGKVLVPWFNLAEWQHVYNLIYSEKDKDWPKALEILKIWKHRTPLLSAGVEGTLILLEALLVNVNQLSSYESSHIFSTSLVRFLNLCAANSDKQGTFYKTAMQNELPTWLINIRHEIAHSHKVPALSMLDISLKFCLEWLQGKYWDVQKDNMKEFILRQSKNTVVEDSIYIYIHLDQNIGGKNRELRKRIRRYIKGDRSKMSNTDIMEYINKELWNEINRNKEPSIEKICTLLIDNVAFFSVECETEKSDKKIPIKFLNKWNNLINMLYDAEILQIFVTNLFNFIYNESHIFSYREIASLWLKEIFIGLINREKNINSEGGLVFQQLHKSMKSQEFATTVMEKVTPFTLNFIKEVLLYHNASSEFIEDFIPLVTAFQARVPPKSDKIFTITDLDITEDLLSNYEISHQKNSRWMLIEDTISYVNLPLGILPHQDRNINPLLVT